MFRIRSAFQISIILCLVLVPSAYAETPRNPRFEIKKLITEKYMPTIEALIPVRVAVGEKEQELKSLIKSEHEFILGVDYDRKKEAFANQTRVFREYVLLEEMAGDALKKIVEAIRADLAEVFKKDTINMDEPTIRKTILEAVEAGIRDARPEEKATAAGVALDLNKAPMAQRFTPVMNISFGETPEIKNTGKMKHNFEYKYKIGQKIELTVSIVSNIKYKANNNDLKILTLRNLKGVFTVREIDTDGAAIGEVVYNDLTSVKKDHQYQTFDSNNEADFEKRPFTQLTAWYDTPFPAKLLPDGVFALLEFDESILSDKIEDRRQKAVKKSIKDFHTNLFVPVPAEEQEPAVGSSSKTVQVLSGPIGQYTIQTTYRIQAIAEDGRVLFLPTVDAKWEQAKDNTKHIRTINRSDYKGWRVFNYKKGMAESGFVTRFKDYVDMRNGDMSYFVTYLEFRVFIQ